MNDIIYHVDAFTTEPFTGNPAGVFISSGTLAPDYMQQVAAELNLSETAFLTPQEDGFRIRFYTPVAEVDLCGHATLSSAHILYELGIVETDRQIAFHSKAGVLNVSFMEGLIIMDLPAFKIEKTNIPPDFKKVTGLKPEEFYRSDYGWHMAVLKTEKEVYNAKPDTFSLKKTSYGNLIITSEAAHKDIDFVTRCFVPDMGIDEDPVTGSAHCALTPYWSKRISKEEMTSYQASSRGGYLRVRHAGERVMVAGNAITIMECELKA